MILQNYASVDEYLGPGSLNFTYSFYHAPTVMGLHATLGYMYI